MIICPIASIGQIINTPQLTIGNQNDTTSSAHDPNAIRLINSDYGTFYIEKDNTINVVVGSVIFEHKGEKLYADSARLNVTKNTLYAYKNVRITQTDGTTCYADYMFYNGNTDIVELRGRVQIISNNDNLWSDKIIYNMKTNIGYYDVGGVLQTGTTVISSQYAQYNGNTYDARFKGNVNVEDPEYIIVSSDLNYNTESKIAKFYGPSIVKSDSTILYTTDGYYDTYNEIAQFNKRSSIFTQKQYIEADTLDYDKSSGLGIGRGNVVLIDSLRKMNIYGQFATINETTGQALVVDNPFALMYEDHDTTWVIADTFFTEPIKNLELYFEKPENMSAQDSLIYTLDILRRSKIEIDSISITDSTIDFTNDFLDFLNTPDTIDQDVSIDSIVDSSQIDPVRGFIDTSQLDVNKDLDSILNPDSTVNPLSQMDSIVSNTDSILSIPDSLMNKNLSVDSVMSSHLTLQDVLLSDSLSTQETVNEDDLRYLIAYRNVFIYNDSFQAKSDSLRYSQQDTLLIFYKNPVLWAQDQQVIGDVIEALVDSNQIRYIHIPKNGILIAQSTKKNEVMFDQIQANEIWAHFSNNKIDSVTGTGNAQTIYYATDESKRYIGVSEASSMHLMMVFENDSLNDKRQLSDIIYYTDYEQEMIPMSQANFSELKLSRFRWRAAEKMPSKEVFLELIKSRQYSSSLRDEVSESIKNDKK